MPIIHESTQTLFPREDETHSETGARITREMVREGLEKGEIRTKQRIRAKMMLDELPDGRAHLHIRIDAPHWTDHLGKICWGLFCLALFVILYMVDYA